MSSFRATFGSFRRKYSAISLGWNWIELMVRRHHALEDLAVELAQESRPILHEDEVGDPLEHDVVGERGRQAGEVTLDHRDLPRLGPPEDLAGVVQVHDHMEDFVVGLLDYREVFDLMKPVEHPLGP